MVDPSRAIRDENRLSEAPREWLVANGLGGYASATITGAITRRYHGLLIAAQPPPLGRTVVLEDLEVDIELEDGSIANMRENGQFRGFTLNMGLPSWRYELDGVVIETSIAVPSRQNIVHFTLRSLSDGRRLRLRLRPLINFRPLEAPVSEALSSDSAGYHWFTDWGRDTMSRLCRALSGKREEGGEDVRFIEQRRDGRWAERPAICRIGGIHTWTNSKGRWSGDRSSETRKAGSASRKLRTARMRRRSPVGDTAAAMKTLT